MNGLKAVFRLFNKISAQKDESNLAIDEKIVGKPLSADILKEICPELGYDFEIFVNGEGKCYRFRRITPKSGFDNGDCW